MSQEGDVDAILLMLKLVTPVPLLLIFRRVRRRMIMVIMYTLQVFIS